MQFLYNISTLFYILGIRIASLFNSKAKLWIKGRKNIFQKLKTETEKQNNIVWFHCASLGEFEQGKPIIEAYKRKYSYHKILLTFFSASGFEIRKNTPLADFVFYLPADTKANAKKLINIVNPIKVVFIKYEFWFNYMSELKRQNIPFYSVSCIFRKEQVFFKYGWFTKQLKNVSHFFVQNQISADLLNSIGFDNFTISGDSRFDSVMATANNAKSFPLIQEFCKYKPTIICGSTWPKDEELIIQFIKENKQYNYIIAPHELSHLNRLQESTNELIYSKANEKNIVENNLLIIDSIGILSSIYQYGKIAYIGGGFGSGIHNILEATTFGLTVIFGPNYQNSNEANELIELGAAKSISNFEQLRNAISYFENNPQKENCKRYVLSKTGASEIILNSI